MNGQGRPRSRRRAWCPRPDRVRIPGVSQEHTSAEPTVGWTHDFASGRRTSGGSSLLSKPPALRPQKAEGALRCRGLGGQRALWCRGLGGQRVPCGATTLLSVHCPTLLITGSSH